MRASARDDRNDPCDGAKRYPSGNRQHAGWPAVVLLAAALAGGSSCSRQKPADGQAEEAQPPRQLSSAEARAMVEQVAPRAAPRHSPRHYLRRGGSDATAAELSTLAADYSQAKDATARRALMDKLASYCDPEAVSIVMSALGDPSAEVRAAALEALSGYTSADVVAPALKGLQDADVAVRRAAMEALSCVADASAAEAIALAFTDADGEVREAAFDCLQEVPYEAQIGLLEEALKAPAVDVRQAAVSELEDLSNHDAMDLLLQAMRDSDAQVREDAADAIWFLVSERFTDADTARRWWQANRNRFDEDLFEKD